MYQRYGKRCFDLFVAILLIILLSPCFLLVGLLVRLRFGAPIFFRQERPGLDGQPFVLCKFRTMLDTCDSHGHLLPDAERLPWLGHFLRCSSLDELPQLFNILQGDMSLVGPRPLLMEYLSLYTPEQARRHHVQPGITGWAQVNGRNAISWEEKFAYDLWYVDNCSFSFDLKILSRTFIQVIRRAGISQVGQVTVQKFIGSRS